jgi:transcriptional regulator with XRE-family HTH domain
MARRRVRQLRWVGPRLRAVRQAAGLSPEQIGVAVRRSALTVLAYERGTVLPSAAMVAALADAIGCSVEELFERS